MSGCLPQVTLTNFGRGPVMWMGTTEYGLLAKPLYPSMLVFDSEMQAKWADGSEERPICLPVLQETTDPVAKVIGLTDEGCMVAVAGSLVAPIQSIVAGDRITVDNTDPLNPIINADLQTDGFWPYSNDAYIVVETSGNATTNGTALQLAYTAAKLLTPNGAAISATNRATVVLPPATYNLGTGQLQLDTQYIDIIGLTTDREAQRITSATANTSNQGTIRQTANDVHIENIALQNTSTFGGTYTATDSAAYFPDTNLSSTRMKNVLLIQGGGQAWCMRLGVEYSGNFQDVVSGDGSFGGGFGGVSTSAISSGTFINCVGGYGCFGGNSGSSCFGTFINCRSGNNSFGGQFATLDGTCINCRAGTNSFWIDATVGANANIVDCYMSGGYSNPSSIDANAIVVNSYCDVGSVFYNFPSANIRSSLFAMADFVAVPPTAASPGTAGQMAYEPGFLYVCVSASTWERVPLTTF